MDLFSPLKDFLVSKLGIIYVLKQKKVQNMFGWYAWKDYFCTRFKREALVKDLPFKGFTIYYWKTVNLAN